MKQTPQSDRRRTVRRLAKQYTRAAGFTLVELLISITIIGILSALALGAFQKASTRAKAIKTQSTIAKLHQQVMTKWESYKFKRLAVDPQQLLLPLPNVPTPYSQQTVNARLWCKQLWQNRGSIANDPLGVGVSDPAFPTGQMTTPGFPTAAQIAAVKLLAMRETQRYEMPTGWSDIIDTDTAGNWQGSPGNWNLRTPNVLLVPPQLALSYLSRVNTARDAQGNTPSQQQLQNFDAAETLYFVVKFASEDENNALLDSVKEVGDADGDGLPEFQDAFAGMESVYQAATPNNNPIFWNRWPAGFTNLNRADSSGNFIDSLHISDFQDDPTSLVEEQAGGVGTSLQVVGGAQAMATFSQDNHDYFDPLRLDIPGNSGTQRGYQLTPLIFSAGPDSLFGSSADGFGKLQGVAWNDQSFSLPQQTAFINDPYAVDSHGYRNAPWIDLTTTLPMRGTADNITNHVMSAR